MRNCQEVKNILHKFDVTYFKESNIQNLFKEIGQKMSKKLLWHIYVILYIVKR